MDAFSTPSHFEKTMPAVKYLPASFGKKCMTGMRERSGFFIASFPSLTIFPSKVASESFFTISFSFMPSADASVHRSAVTFITVRALPIWWKKRILSVAAACCAAFMSSGEHGPVISTTNPSLRIFSINSRIVTTPASRERMGDPEVIDNPGHYHVHKIIDLLRVVVEPGARRHNGRAGFMRRKHVL